MHLDTTFFFRLYFIAYVITCACFGCQSYEALMKLLHAWCAHQRLTCMILFTHVTQNRNQTQTDMHKHTNMHEDTQPLMYSIKHINTGVLSNAFTHSLTRAILGAYLGKCHQLCKSPRIYCSLGAFMHH